MTVTIGGLSRRSLLAGAAALTAVPAMAQARPIVVASKIDTEGGLLGQMIALLLEKAGMTIENRVPLGPTRIVRTALVAGEIDIYPEYTGNAAFFHQIPADPAWKDMRAGFEKARDLDQRAHDIVWLPNAPANNTWAIAVRSDLARAHDLRTLEDLAPHLAAGRPFKLAARRNSSRARPRCRPSRAPMASRCPRTGCWCCRAGIPR